MKVLIAESGRFCAEALAVISGLGEVDAADVDRAGLLARVGDCEVLWVRLRHRVDRDLLNAAGALRVIVTPTTGLDHIDEAEVARRGMTILSLKGETEFLRGIHATAEHTLALTLALLRQVVPAAAHVDGGGWNRDLFRGREIQGKTVGIVGYGRLGRIVAGYFVALGASVLATDPNVSQDAMEDHVAWVPFRTLLQQSDIVSLHVSLDEASDGMFDETAFDAMKPGAILVNTARGAVLDEQALLAHLESGRLGGAALDVLCHEDSTGMQAHTLVAYARAHRNLLVTPHIGGCTDESMASTELFMAKKLASFYGR